MELARNLKVESVCRLQPTTPLQILPRQSVAEAVDLMRRFHVGCVLVCEAGRLIGLFTERDLLRRVLATGRPLSAPIEEVMTRQPVVVSLKDPIGLAVERMEQGGYRHLPVVDLAGRPVGMLSVKRIVHYLVEHFPATIYNLPPDPDAFPRHAEEREQEKNVPACERLSPQSLTPGTMICPICTTDNLPGSEVCCNCLNDLTHLDRPTAHDRVERSLMEDPVSALKPRPPVTLPPNATVGEAIQAMLADNIGAVLIVEGGKLVAGA